VTCIDCVSVSFVNPVNFSLSIEACHKDIYGLLVGKDFSGPRQNIFKKNLSLRMASASRSRGPKILCGGLHFGFPLIFGVCYAFYAFITETDSFLEPGSP